MSFAKRWAEGYQRAWEAGDPDAAAALYRPDCVFRSAPFRDPEPPIEYTRRVFPEARAEDVRFGEPVEAGGRAGGAGGGGRRGGGGGVGDAVRPGGNRGAPRRLLDLSFRRGRAGRGGPRLL